MGRRVHITPMVRTQTGISGLLVMTDDMHPKSERGRTSRALNRKK